jgi:adenylate kinase
MLRAAIAAGTEVGKKAKAIMDRGDLVSDDVVIGIVADRMDQPDIKAGVTFDGFPRTPAQAEALDGMLAGRKQKLDAVIEMKVDDEALVERITGRYTCAKCGKGYHEKFAPTEEGGGLRQLRWTEFTRRPTTTKRRSVTVSQVYNKQTAPLVAYYAAKGNLHVIDGMADICPMVTGEIGAVLKKVKG